MMKNYLNIVGILLILYTSFYATTTVAQSIQQINDIKRNDAYLFEEATAATAEEAHESALMKLAKVLADYMAETNPEGAKNLDDFKDLAEGSEEIVADRGTQKRVFLYFKKSDIDAIADDAVQKPKPKDQEEVPFPPVTEQPVELTTKPEVDLEEPPVEILAELPEPQDMNTTEIQTIRVTINDNSLAEWQKRVIEKFTGVKTLLEAKDLVNTLRIENQIKRYGTNNTQQKNPAEAFYVIANEHGHIVAVLGRDINGQRMNYKTSDVDDINNYQTFDYIWFTLNK